MQHCGVTSLFSRPKVLAQAGHAQDIPMQQYRDELLAGRPLHFNPGDENRVILAEWIKEAVSRSALIDIRYAVVRGPLDLKQSRVSTDFKLLSCDVEGRADFSSATFQHDVLLDDTIFQSEVDFTQAELDSNFSARHVKFAASATFAASQVRGVAVFHEDEFSGDAIFNYSTIAVNVDFRGSVFRRNVSFGNAKLGKIALFGDYGLGPQHAPARFEGKADFTNAEMQGAFFGGVVFAAAVDFGQAQIRGSARFSKALFKDRTTFQDARFQGFLVQSAVWETKVDFSRMQIGSMADFSGARLGGAKGVVVFDRTYINGDAYFAQAVFNTLTVFTNIQIKGDAIFSGATFRETTLFDGAQISGRALFGQGQPPLPTLPAATFDADVTFYRAKIGGMPTFFRASLRNQ